MNRLRTRLLLVFLAATLVPVIATLAVTWQLLEHSIDLHSTRELDDTSRSLERTGRALYASASDALRAEVESKRISPSATYRNAQRSSWPNDVREFAESNEAERFQHAGEKQDQVQYLLRTPGGVLLYARPIGGGAGLKDVADQYARAREVIERAAGRDLRRGFVVTLGILAVAVWGTSFGVTLYLARRISKPMEDLTAGLSQLASGNLDVRLRPDGSDEIASAMKAFNSTAEELKTSQEKLIHVTRLASWQNLARKMAHEVKNSLTPIRLTMEEVVARRGERDDMFLEQAAQIVVDEVGVLERRVRAFTEFASEPPVQLEDLDVNAVLEERIALLRAAHPEVAYDTDCSRRPIRAHADADLVKGVLTNLLENAAQAAGAGGTVLSRTMETDGRIAVEIHDSGPGLTEQARTTLFEPTISFKKAGMGLGLSIARRSAVLVGGDIVLVRGELGGAGFRVVLPPAEDHAVTARAGS